MSTPRHRTTRPAGRIGKSAAGWPAAEKQPPEFAEADTDRETSRSIRPSNVAWHSLRRIALALPCCTADGRPATHQSDQAAAALAAEWPASLAIHIDIDVAAAIFGCQSHEKLAAIVIGAAAEVQAVNRGPPGCRFANRAKLSRIERRIAAVGEQKNHFRLHAERRQESAAVFGLPKRGQIGDELHELALVLGRCGNQLAIGDIGD